MSIAFPSSPTNGQFWTDAGSGITYQFTSPPPAWRVVSGGSGSLGIGGNAYQVMSKNPANTGIEWRDAGVRDDGTVAIGKDNALGFAGVGPRNVAIGSTALFAWQTIGADNVAIGNNAIFGLNSVGNGNIAIGADARLSTDNNSYEIVIGYQALGHGSNTVTLGNASVTQLYLGNTPVDVLPGGGAPDEVLTKDSVNNPEWRAIIRFPIGGTANQVVAKDTAGNLEWQSLVRVPEGGAADQVLAKDASNSGLEWQTRIRVPVGGGANDILAKNPGNSALEWQALIRLPPGGNAFQVASKNAANDAIEWRDAVPPGGNAFQALSKNAGNTGAEWRTVGSRVNDGTVVGAGASSATTGARNTAVGFNALAVGSSANNNVAIGANALAISTNGAFLVAIGADALGAILGGGNYSVAVGYKALEKATARNIGVGGQTLGELTTGSQNVAAGYQAGMLTAGGANVTTSNNSIFIGDDARPSANSETNQIVLGNAARGKGSNSVTLGATATTKLYVGDRDYSEQPIAFVWGGTPVAGTVIVVPLVHALSIPLNLAGSVYYNSTNPLVQSVFTLARVTSTGGVTTIGTITKPAGTGTATFSGNGSSVLVAGDTLRMTATTIGGSITNVGITVLAYRR